MKVSANKGSNMQVLRNKRESVGLTIRALAAKLDMSAGHLSDIETGKANASFETLARIVTTLSKLQS